MSEINILKLKMLSLSGSYLHLQQNEYVYNLINKY